MTPVVLHSESYQHYFGRKPMGFGTYIFRFPNEETSLVLTGDYDKVKWRAIRYAKAMGHGKVTVNVWL